MPTTGPLTKQSVCIELPSGDTIDPADIAYAEMRSASGDTTGVLIQYSRPPSDDGPTAEFIEGARIVATQFGSIPRSDEYNRLLGEYPELEGGQ